MGEHCMLPENPVFIVLCKDEWGRMLHLMTSNSLKAAEGVNACLLPTTFCERDNEHFAGSWLSHFQAWSSRGSPFSSTLCFDAWRLVSALLAMQPHSTGHSHAGGEKCCFVHMCAALQACNQPRHMTSYKDQRGPVAQWDILWVLVPAAGAAGRHSVLHEAMLHLRDLTTCRLVALWELCRQGCPAAETTGQCCAAHRQPVAGRQSLQPADRWHPGGMEPGYKVAGHRSLLGACYHTVLLS